MFKVTILLIIILLALVNCTARNDTSIVCASNTFKLNNKCYGCNRGVCCIYPDDTRDICSNSKMKNNMLIIFLLPTTIILTSTALVLCIIFSSYGCIICMMCSTYIDDITEQRYN
jgi:hypothetical protein